MLVKTFTSTVMGVEARTITVEVHAGGPAAPGQNNYHLVGLPDNAIKEGFQRISSAMSNVKYRMPRQHLVVNLAPADLRKEGAAYDLPIALGILAASGQISPDHIDRYIIIGELSLDGGLRPVKGVLPIAIQARKEKFEGIIVPVQNAREAAIVSELKVYGAESLTDIIQFFNGTKEMEPFPSNTRELFMEQEGKYAIDFSDVKGQQNIKRALELAAAGGHNAILIGPPGAGKTMLAKRIPTILPPLSLYEALETTKIHSVAGHLSTESSLVSVRPFRSPHHTISDVALVGGGSNPNPGEISLAHNGVLFLDELPEFKRTALEVLRQPMENRKVTISRAKMTVDFPANFMLIASMNPCPCGFFNHPEKDCVCPEGVRKRYLNKISGPLLDRIDLHVEVTPVSYQELSRYENESEPSENIRLRVIKAREIQQLRFKNMSNMHCNAQMPSKMVRETCQLDTAGTAILKTAMEKLQLSARAYDRILKVARTAADMDGSRNIETSHVAQAIHYRQLDREGWLG